MIIRFWGTRGSLPAPSTAPLIREKIRRALELAVEKGLGATEEIEAFIDDELPFWVKGTYGTNTSCIEIREGDDFLLCDAGTGLRDFANHSIQSPVVTTPPSTFHILLTHFHWDHIQGFPFFAPAYIKGNHIIFYGCHQEMKEALALQQTPPFFPVGFEDLMATIDFVLLEPGNTYPIAGFRVTAKPQNHPGTSYGYRFERDARAVVYSTDVEHRYTDDRDAVPFLAFYDKADLLIYDAMYPFRDAITIKQDWGHSNNLMGVELAKKAGVKHLCFYHHEPMWNDRDLDKFYEDTKKLASLIMEGKPLNITLAWDGRQLTV